MEAKPGVHIAHFQLRLELDQGDSGVEIKLQLRLNHAQFELEIPLTLEIDPLS